jgi:tRNA(Ile)-lysidine synthase
MPILDQLSAAIDSQLEAANLKNSLLVAACSGGGDSVALLRLLHSIGIPLIAAHLNHGVRGQAGNEDAQFVVNLAESLHLTCEIGSWRPSRLTHFESDARKARYAWLLEIAQRHGARAVAVGHTREDQAETILHRIIRGTGLRGLCGMVPSRPLGPGVALVRPLLEVDRSDLRDYLRSINQAWREDSSNTDTKRTRARIRNDLIPKLAAEFNPRILHALSRLGQLATEELDSNDEALTVLERLIVLSSDPVSLRLDRTALAPMSHALRKNLLRRAWRRVSWPEREMSGPRWQRIATSIDDRPSRFDLCGGITVEIEANVVYLKRRREVSSSNSLTPLEPHPS